MIAATTIVLGAGAGATIAYLVTDETEWYQKWFFISATTLFAISVLTLAQGPYPLLVSIIAGTLFTGIAVLALRAANTALIALATAALAIIGGVGTWQLLLVALIPTTGYLYPRIAHKQLLWFLLVPTIIITWTLLS